VHNLLVMNQGPAQQELFDLIVVDEASQMDVASSTLALAALASGGSVVLAGDPRQLPPINKAEPPLDLEARVGSIYRYVEEVHAVPPVMLDENYRSNRTLVEFALSAGYRPTLRSYSPDLRLDLLSRVPTARPADWPASLYWTPDWSALLEPDHPAVCFVYSEGRSSQSNGFEADAVAALALLLHGRVGDQLANERDPRNGGAIKVPAARRPYGARAFWERGLGIVTPHRAQEGLVVDRLREVFPGTDPALIRDAVDTVERFQGQERDLIIASFALGDPDAIFQEDEFLLSLNRFNVLASRARAKLIVFVSQEVVDHLSGDLETLRESRLLKLFAQSFCQHKRPLALGHVVEGSPKLVPGILRYR
jgi:superfamily I DNA and/or RNA helicase